MIDDLQLHPISDGNFVARPSYFDAIAACAGHREVFDRNGAAVLPIGCFLIRSLDRSVLVDTGLGPHRKQLPDGMELHGGQLLDALAGTETAPDGVTDIVCTHLHSDHVGWLFDRVGEPVFPAARIWFGAADWTHFIEGPGEMDAHIRAGFRRHKDSPRLRPLEHAAQVIRGVRTVPAPGHTPGHICVLIDLGDRRALLLGDAITHPVQLDEPTWHSFGDVDPDLAHHTRERLWRTLEAPRITGTGAHFPGLRFGRVDAQASPRRWYTDTPPPGGHAGR